VYWQPRHGKNCLNPRPPPVQTDYRFGIARAEVAVRVLKKTDHVADVRQILFYQIVAHDKIPVICLFVQRPGRLSTPGLKLPA
jgi:hypothetical protein